MIRPKQLLLGIALLLLLLPVASAYSHLPGPSENQNALPDFGPLLHFETSLVDDPTVYLPHDLPYARVTYVAPIYRTPEDAAAGRAFTRYGSGNRWATVHDEAEINGKTFYHISWGWTAEGWVAGDALSFSASLSRLKGVDISQRADEHLAMVHHEALNVRSEPGVLSDETLVGTLERYSLVTVQEQRSVDGARWYRIGPDQWVNSFFVRNFRPSSRPGRIPADQKWIEVNLREQTVIAHEGDTAVFATLTSTGRRGYETKPGLYHIWIKYEMAPMTWTNAVPPYSLANVPWIAYFSLEGQGLHGVYWHDTFGTVRSAGCVNLSPHDAHWIFHWSDPPLADGEDTARPERGTRGTWVWVH
ncbi:MAG: L,D-transpeptidase [Chloroflexota bacterium]